MIKRIMAKLTSAKGVEEIKAVGQKFNPETMEAIGEAEAEGGDEGTSGESGIVLEELQKGYITEGKVLRPAKVKVTK